jgi:phosphodiesterase/alkaline phosphatase D-like protein
MSGIKGMIGFTFWVNNTKKEPIEALLNGHNGYSKERTTIMHDLEKENINNLLKRTAQKIGDAQLNHYN